MAVRCSAFLLGAALVAGTSLAAGDCADRLDRLERLVEMQQDAIPSESLNALFTHQERAREACAADAALIAEKELRALVELLEPDLGREALDGIAR
jgi:hypothetical protein